MTATNHALTGIVIALAVKKPELAIPLAFLSHFALDAIPHYNPPKVTKELFTNFPTNWRKKFADPLFRAIFAGDMFLFVLLLIGLPFIHHSGVVGWTIFFSALVAASPDFISGRYLIYQVLKIKPINPNKISFLSRFHIWVQWMERPWGIMVELVWFILMVWLIHNLTRWKLPV